MAICKCVAQQLYVELPVLVLYVCRCGQCEIRHSDYASFYKVIDVLLEHGLTLSLEAGQYMREFSRTPPEDKWFSFGKLAGHLIKRLAEKKQRSNTTSDAGKSKIIAFPKDSPCLSQGGRGSASDKACWACGTNVVPLKKCSVCNVARYCGANCQKIHWKSHKSECATLKR